MFDPNDKNQTRYHPNTIQNTTTFFLNCMTWFGLQGHGQRRCCRLSHCE